MRRKLRYTTASVLATALVFAVSGCGGDDDEPNAEPTPTPSETTSPSPTMDPSAWTNKYNEKLVAQFDEALERFTTYEKAIEPFWAAGKASDKAKKLMAEHWFFPQWEDEFEQLKTYERSKIQRKGLPEVLWSKPKVLKPRVVVIQQCVDPSPVELLLDGEPVDSKAITHPYVRTIQLDKPKRHEFLILEIKGITNKKKAKRCSA